MANFLIRLFVILALSSKKALITIATDVIHDSANNVALDTLEDISKDVSENVSENVVGMNLAKDLASKLNVSIRMGVNFGHDEDCSLGAWGLCYTQTITLSYFGEEEVYENNEFKIYFSSVHRLLHVTNHDDEFEFGHVVGDLTYIAPSERFRGFSPGRVVDIVGVFEYWSVQESDVMPRWFVVDERDNSTAIIANTDTEQLRDFVVPYTALLKTREDRNVIRTPHNRFEYNQESAGSSSGSSSGKSGRWSDRIIPTPYHVDKTDDAIQFRVTGLDVVHADLLGNFSPGFHHLRESLGIASGGHRVLLETALPADNAGRESYKLTISAAGSSVAASHPAGWLYGLVTLMHAIGEGGLVEEGIVSDKPRFPHRGHHVDVARNFRSMDAIRKTIDAMALWKMNVLHLGLTNDEGWRLEIPGLPELTEIGSKRCFDLDEKKCLLTQLGSGPLTNENEFYSRKDFIALVKYAHERNVYILPELNMPGHARAAVISMEARAKKGDSMYRLMDPKDETFLLTTQYYDKTSIINPCLDSSVRFVQKLITEVIDMYNEAKVPLTSYHFGGDEAYNILLGNAYQSYPDELKQRPFSKSPACQAKIQNDPSFDIDHVAKYWAGIVNDILAKEGIDEMVAWEDGLEGTTANDYATTIKVNFWQTLFWGGIDGLVDVTQRGFDVILSNPDYLYFDFPYEVNPRERGYYWGARFNSVEKVFAFAPENLPQNAETTISGDIDGNAMSYTTPDSERPRIYGMQGQTWGETIRTDEEYFEMAFPRVLAVAERAWHRASWEMDWSPGMTYNSATNIVSKDDLAKDYERFVTMLGCNEVIKLQNLGIAYRVPPPGAKINESGLFMANSELPCTPILYSLDGGKQWHQYVGPIKVDVNARILVKSVSSNGTSSSPIVKIDQQMLLEM